MTDGFLILRHISVRGNRYECPLGAHRVLRDVAPRHVQGLRKVVRTVSIVEKVNTHEDCSRRALRHAEIRSQRSGVVSARRDRLRAAARGLRSTRQPLSSVAYNWPPRPPLIFKLVFTLLSVSQPGHSLVWWGPNDATLLFEFGNRTRAPWLLQLLRAKPSGQDQKFPRFVTPIAFGFCGCCSALA